MFSNKELQDNKVTYVSRFLNPAFKVIVPAIIIILAFALLTFFSVAMPLFPLALVSALFMGAFAYLSGIGYGILNDLIATRVNLEYFMFGHNWGQEYGLLKNTKDPNAHAFAWGIVATHPLALIAGIIFALATFILILAGGALPVSAGILLSICIVAVVMLAHVFSRLALPTYDNIEKNFDVKQIAEDISPQYKKIEHKTVEGQKKFYRNWWSNNLRNGFGYVVLPTTAVGLLITTIVMGSLHMEIAAFAALSVPLQVALMGAPAVLMLIGFAYFAYRMHRVRSQISKAEKLSDIFHGGPDMKLQEIGQVNSKCFDNQSILPLSDSSLGDSDDAAGNESRGEEVSGSPTPSSAA